VVVVKFETRAQKEARITPLHTRREGGREVAHRRSAGRLDPRARKEKEKKKEKEGLQIRSSPVDATRRDAAALSRSGRLPGPAVMRRGSSSGWKQAARRRDGRASFRRRPCPWCGSAEEEGKGEQEGGGFGERKERRMRRGRESPGVGWGCCCAAQAAGKGRRASRERAARHVFRYRCRPRLPPAAFDF
jgi:hypothetical protein